MKAVAANHAVSTQGESFYLSHLAPINHHKDTPFRGWDAALLVVLFLEIAVVMRLILAD